MHLIIQMPFKVPARMNQTYCALYLPAAALKNHVSSVYLKNQHFSIKFCFGKICSLVYQLLLFSKVQLQLKERMQFFLLLQEASNSLCPLPQCPVGQGIKSEIQFSQKNCSFPGAILKTGLQIHFLQYKWLFPLLDSIAGHLH